MRKLDFVIDCDDVIRDFVPEWISTYNIENKTNHKIEDVKDFDIRKVLTKIDDYKTYLLSRPEIFLNSKPCNNSIETLNYLKNKEHNIIIATNQHKGLELITLKWLKMYNVPYDNIFFGKDKHLIKGDVFVDDCFQNVVNYDKFNINSLLFMINKPWNKYIDTHNLSQITRINSLSDLVKYF